MHRLKKLTAVFAVCCLSMTAFSCSMESPEEDTSSYKEITPETRAELASDQYIDLNSPNCGPMSRILMILLRGRKALYGSH